jgi:hypothetical protein
MPRIGYQRGKRLSRDFVGIESVLQQLMSKLKHNTEKDVMNKPVETFKNKGLKVAVWPTRNGGYSYSINKSYKDKQTGEWKETKSFFKEEVEALIDLLKQAMGYGGSREEHENEAYVMTPPAQLGKGYELSEDDVDDLPF